MINVVVENIVIYRRLKQSRPIEDNFDEQRRTFETYVFQMSKCVHDYDEYEFNQHMIVCCPTREQLHARRI
jgi:hypothetical protein